jgi:iron-sulfur cluster assembly protein
MDLPIVQPGAPTSLNEVVRLTPLAAEKVRELLAQRGTPEQALRLGVRGGGCSGNSYTMEYCEQETEGDLVLESHGVRLVVDRRSAVVLQGTEVDYVTGLMGSGFKFNNPNVRHACACGESFSV